MHMYYTWIEDHYVDGKNLPSMTVSATEPESKFTGLYDASGNKLYSVRKPEPIGFLWHTDAA